MKQIKLCKEFSFSSAHSLPLHAGLCKNIHGHTYTLQVYVQGPLETQELPNKGMVIDFATLKQIVTDRVISKLDHQYLNDTLDFTTTAENMAVWILSQLQEAMDDHNGTFGKVEVTKIRLYETPTCFVEVEA